MNPPLPSLPRCCSWVGTVHTLGHSTREAQPFLLLLQEHNIGCVVDVRRWPHSRRYPHFCRSALAAFLAAAGIGYVWREELGGFRRPRQHSPNDAWRTPGFRGYADYMEQREFKLALAEVELLACSVRICLLCAEAQYWRCHRRLLSDALLVRGWTVRHIVEAGSPCQPHWLPPFAQYSAGSLVYSAGKGKDRGDSRYAAG